MDKKTNVFDCWCYADAAGWRGSSPANGESHQSNQNDGYLLLWVSHVVDGFLFLFIGFIRFNLRGIHSISKLLS